MTLLDHIVREFIRSPDHNGATLVALRHLLETDDGGIRACIRELVRDEKVALAFASRSENPHIKRLPDLPVHEQLELLENEALSGICAYPASSVILERVPQHDLSNEPYTRRLALAEAQLTPVYFDLSVLERYERDPRFDFTFHDFGGSITISEQYYESPDMHERDKILLKTFGIGYDSKRRRVVVSFLRYLSHLSAEHQRPRGVGAA